MAGVEQIEDVVVVKLKFILYSVCSSFRSSYKHGSDRLKVGIRPSFSDPPSDQMVADKINRIWSETTVCPMSNYDRKNVERTGQVGLLITIFINGLIRKEIRKYNKETNFYKFYGHFINRLRQTLLLGIRYAVVHLIKQVVHGTGNHLQILAYCRGNINTQQLTCKKTQK